MLPRRTAGSCDGIACGGAFYLLGEVEFIIAADPDVIFLADSQCCGVTAESVAARAGCSKQTLYARYGSRQGLMAQVALDGMALARLPAMPTATTLRPALLAFARQHLDHLCRPSTIGAARLLTAQAQQFPQEVTELFVGWAGTLQAQLAAWLQQAMRRGLASVWTRYGADNSGTAAPAAPAAQLADKLGG